MFERWGVIYQLIQQLSVICHDIGDIIAVFESAFDLEGGYARLDHFGKMQTAIHILQREQVALVDRFAMDIHYLVAIFVE